MKVSVVITNYNYRQFVCEAIDSALAQAALQEVIVVDDGSTDGSVEMLTQRYREHPVVRVISTPNRGQLAAFAQGVAAASGEWVAFLDADDLWQPGYLRAVTNAYSQHPKVDFLFSNMRYFDQHQGLSQPEAEDRDLGISVLLGCFNGRWQASATSGLSMRRALALRILDVPEDMKLQWRTRADDCLASGADILGARKYYLAHPWVLYRAHGANSWLHQSLDASENLLHWLRVEAMRAFYRRKIGLKSCERSHLLRYVKHEFRTKPLPNYAELTAYLGLLKQSAMPWNKRLEHRASMWAYYLKRLLGHVIRPAVAEAPAQTLGPAHRS